jgi:hypothetical protein
MHRIRLHGARLAIALVSSTARRAMTTRGGE